MWSGKRIFGTVLLAALIQYAATDCGNTGDDDLPVRKIYVHGKPVLVRQIIEIESGNTLSLTRAGKQYKNDLLSDNLQCFSSAANSINSDKDRAWARSKRYGFPPLIPPLVPPAPVAAAPVAPQVVQSPPQYIYVPGPPTPMLASQVVSPYILPAPPVPASAGVAPAIAASVIPLPEQQGSNSNYPLPECYTDSSNFMCCHRGLENMLRETFHQTLAQGVNLCNIQKISNAIQNSIESAFNSNFEVVIGLNDFASKSHFYHNFICKVEEQNRYILAYATPKSEEEFQNANAYGTGGAGGSTDVNGESAGVSGKNEDSHGQLPPQHYGDGQFANNLQSLAEFGNVPQPQAGMDGQQPPHYDDSIPRHNHVYVWRK